MGANKNKAKMFEEKRITNHFLISNDKYRLCYTPKGNTKKVSILLNYHITCFGHILKKIIDLKKYNTIKIFTKSIFINEDKHLNDKFFEEILVNEYSYVVYDLDMIRDSQEESYSLFCRMQKNRLP